MTLDSVENFTVLYAGTVALTGFTVSDIEFVAQVIELDDNSQSLIEAQNQNKIHIRTQSYRTSTNTIPGGS